MHVPAVLVNVRDGRTGLLEPTVVVALFATVYAWATCRARGGYDVGERSDVGDR